MAGYVTRGSEYGNAGLMDRTNAEVSLKANDSSYESYVGCFVEVYGTRNYYRDQFELRVSYTCRYDPSIGRELALYTEAMLVSRHLTEPEQEWFEKSAMGTQSWRDVRRESQNQNQTQAPVRRFYSLCRLNSSIRGSGSFAHIPLLDEVPEELRPIIECGSSQDKEGEQGEGGPSLQNTLPSSPPNRPNWPPSDTLADA